LYVNVTGDAMTGPLILAADPTQPTEAATKRYMDNSVAAHVSAVDPHPQYVNITGDTLTGPLTLAADPAQPLHATTRRYVDNTAVAHTSAADPHPQYAVPGYVDQVVTVSIVAPDPAVNIPARDGLFWVQIPSDEG
jgi:hypothetical protein